MASKIPEVKVEEQARACCSLQGLGHPDTFRTPKVEVGIERQAPGPHNFMAPPACPRPSPRQRTPTMQD